MPGNGEDMNSLLILLLASVLWQQPPVRIVQETGGWCSPAIANVTGKVTVNCVGVDPRALQRLNAELNRTNLKLADKIRKANQWTTRYKEVEEQLSKTSDDRGLSRKAEEYLHAGELEKAGSVLDEVLSKEEPGVDRAAIDHYSRGQLFELQFRPLDALPHFEKAYQYRPEEAQFGLRYATALADEKDFKRAEPVFLATLARVRELAKTSPAANQPYVAGTLNNLADLYSETQRLKEAEAGYLEALGIRRELAKANPAAYQFDVAMTLNSLASLYRDTQRANEGEAAYLEALDIYRQLAKSNPATYEPFVAGTLNNLAILYNHTQRVKEGEAAYVEARDIFRQLTKTNPAAYQPDLALTLNNLGNLYRNTQRLKEAETAFLEALGIRRELAKANPAAYQPYVANTLNNLALLYTITRRLKEAQMAYQEALDIYRPLADENPAAYKTYLAA